MLRFRKTYKNISQIPDFKDQEKNTLILFKKNDIHIPHIPMSIKSIISIHTPNAADAQRIFGSIPQHIHELYLKTLPNADDAKKVFGAIPRHVNVLGLFLETLPNADDSKRFFGAILSM